MSYELNQCVWELTTACNLRCKHCGTKAGLARDNELTLEECYQVINNLAYLKCKNVSLIGGEIFLSNIWHIVAQELIKNGIETAIITNGFNVGTRELKQIQESKVKHVCVSVDGTEKTHDYIRGQGSHSSCVKLIKKLKRKGYIVSVITTVSAWNIDDIEKLSFVLAGCSIDAWQIQLCAPFGRACDKASSIPKETKLSKLLDFVVEKREAKQMFILVGDNIGYFTQHEPYIRSPLGKRGCFGGCSAGLITIGIDSIGNVRGCEALYDERFIEGNIREKSLKDIWNSEDAFSFNRKIDLSMLSGKCASCDVRNICLGGCRSINYFSHGKLYESLFCIK
jgi:radical SAM protein with 4Fe4S-binding SPASM domain